MVFGAKIALGAGIGAVARRDVEGARAQLEARRAAGRPQRELRRRGTRQERRRRDRQRTDDVFRKPR